MSYYPKLKMVVIAIPENEKFETYRGEETAKVDQVHLRLMNGEDLRGNLRCTPAEALEYGQQIIDAANSLIEKKH